MNKLFSSIRKISIKQILTAFVLGMLLFVTQACSSVNAKAPDSAYEGGMNQYSDVDPRSKGAQATAEMKAKALRDQAEVNTTEDNVIDTTRRTLDKKGNLENLGKNLKEGAEDTANQAQDSAEDFAKGTKRGIENIKGNTSNAFGKLTNNAGEVAEDAQLSAQRAAQDAKLSTQRAAEDAGNAVQRTLRDVAN
jgi:uncharacterized protein YjbJ (UPF0337 family)